MSRSRRRRVLINVALAIVAGLAAYSPGQASETPPRPQLCGYAYPGDTRFVVEDGGFDLLGNEVRFCSEYTRHGGPKVLGLPISRPFRVGSDVYQAFEYAVLHWQPQTAEAELTQILDLLHDAGRDDALLRQGIPPAQPASMDWLTDPLLAQAYTGSLHPKYGLPTSPPTTIGPYVAQRFERGLIRRWIDAPPTDLPGVVLKLSRDGPAIERPMVGRLLATSGMIPPRALAVDDGVDAQAYNWTAAPDAPDSLWSASSHAPGGWDALFRRAGAFDVGTHGTDERAMVEDVSRATAMELSLAVNGYVGRDSAVVKAGVDRDLGLIDTYLWGRIASACGAVAVRLSCTLGADQLAQISAQVRRHLTVTRRDESVAAYWVLDDDPGDVRAAIDRMHDLVERENLVAQVARPTICGFGGDLDDARRAPLESRSAFDAAVRNFSSTGCDAVALYPYARPMTVDDDGRSIDWSMTDLLPHMLQALRERGWDAARQPLIGMPQTFRFGAAAHPTSVEVATQTTAYCAAGSTAILFYAWDDSAAGPKAELFDAPDLRQGASDGLARCRAMW